MKARVEVEDLQEIRSTLEEIKADVRKMADGSDHSYGRRGYEGRVLDVMLNQLLEDIDMDLDRGMMHRCPMRDGCKAIFTDILHGSADLVLSERVSEELVNEHRSELEKRRAGAPKDQCAKCFGEVTELFDKHVRLARSLRTYRTDEDVCKAMDGISEDTVVKEVLEPISSRQRLQIMKMLSSQERPFSYISEKSGLRGGNLLFHLQRLVDAGLILQRYERGDYLLTDKGFKVLRSITDLVMTLEEGSVDLIEIAPRSIHDQGRARPRSGKK